MGRDGGRLTLEVAPGASVGCKRPPFPGKDRQMKTATLKIEGMSCDHCANTIKTLVEQQPGVKMAMVSFDEGQARILYDPY